MANRHKAFARGGGTKKATGIKQAKVSYGNMDVVNEAKSKKTGGKVVAKAAGGACSPRLDKKARGGKIKASGKDMKNSPFSAAHFKTTGDGA